MNIELRSVNYAAFASEETSCFEAAVWIDGERAGTARNDGHGGCNFYHPPQLGVRLDAYAKTLPPLKSEYFPEGLEQDADILIGDLLNDWQVRRALKRALSNKLLFTKPWQPGKVYETKRLSKAHVHLMANAEWVAQQTSRLGGEKCLNALPFDDAVAIYRQAVGG